MIILRDSQGHRGNYGDILSRDLDLPVKFAKDMKLNDIRAAKAIVIAGFDEHFISAIMIAICALFSSTHVIGIIIRMNSMASRSSKSVLKLFILKILSKLGISFYSIMHQECSAIANNEMRFKYIPDLEFIDIIPKPRKEPKYDIVLIGGVSYRKDVDGFVRYCRLCQKRGWTMGQHDTHSAKIVKENMDAIEAVDRFLTAEEMHEALLSSEFSWCAFTKNYDQSSGLFGHSIQLGVIPIVRTGSYLHKLCMTYKIAHRCINDENGVTDAYYPKINTENYINRCKKKYEMFIRDVKSFDC